MRSPGWLESETEPPHASIGGRGGRPRLVLDSPGLVRASAARLLDGEVRDLQPHLSPIETDYDHRDRLNQAEPNLLPRVLVASERVLGPSSGAFDCHKSSFSFPLLISAGRQGRVIRYVLLLEDVRGALNLGYFRVDLEHTRPQRAYANPQPGDLSRRDLNALSEHLLGYMLGYSEAAGPRHASFYRVIPSERIVYGMLRGHPFARRFDDESEMKRFLAVSAEQGGHRRGPDRPPATRVLERIEPEKFVPSLPR